ncbi:unnamed protein product [Diabrotica balteata]|uniref:Odorant receptor n=1 Tax=Diabrotica balteata TaxID=107213 RepID=A0A9N9X9T5_DIABA|nr:unnamed protein product [Diabrotica balteata]
MALELSELDVSIGALTSGASDTTVCESVAAETHNRLDNPESNTNLGEIISCLQQHTGYSNIEEDVFAELENDPFRASDESDEYLPSPSDTTDTDSDNDCIPKRLKINTLSTLQQNENNKANVFNDLSKKKQKEFKKSEKTADIPFASSWYESGTDIKKPYVIMISNFARRPLYISALGFFTMTVTNAVQSEKTAEIAFASNWEESGSDLKKSYVIMISNFARRPLYISALGFFSLTFTNGLQAIVKCTVMFVNHDKISSLLNDTLLFWKIDTYPFKKERKVAQFMEKVLKFFLFWYPSLATTTTLLVFLSPLIMHKRILPMSTFVPEYPPYWLLYLTECYAFAVIYIGVVYFDVLIGTLVMMVVIQWKLLNRKIHDVLERPVTNQKEKNLLQADIKTCIDYHNFLLNQGATNLSIRIILMLGYNDEFILFYVLPGQLLTSEAENTEKAVFSCNWYENTTGLKKTVITMISCISRKPVYITAANFLNFSFESGLKGLLTLVAAYMKHAEILDLIRDMKNFWELDDVRDEDERNANFAILKTVKIIFIYFLGFAVIPSSFFYFRPFILRKRVLAFNSYIPESIPYPLLYLLETYAFVVIDFSCMAWDGFCATVIILAYVQWRILNREIRRVLELKIESEEDKETMKKKVKRCIDHHHFLYSLVNCQCTVI